MSNLLQHPRIQNQINSLWTILQHIDISCTDIERAMKSLLEMKSTTSAASPGTQHELSQPKSLDAEENCYLEEAFTIPAAILISSLQVKKSVTQRRIQALLGNIAGSEKTESSLEEEDTESSNLFSRVDVLLTSIQEYIKKKRRHVERGSRPSVLQSNVCNMICKSPSNLCFKNGRWEKRVGGIDCLDPNSQYVVALHRRLRRQCQNIILLQQERDALLLENDLLKENLVECQCNKYTRSTCK